MNHYLFNSTVILQHSVELLISFYLLGFISYAVFFNGLQTLAFPALLNSMLLFSTFIIFSSLLLYLTCDLSFLSDNSFGALDITLFDSAFSMILMLSVLFLQIICRKTLNRQGIYKYEYDLIMVFSILGLVLLNGCNDFLVFYLALELQSLGFYVLATFQRNSEYNAEAGLKYFVLGALSSGLLLFGFSLIYITYGSVYFEVITKLSIISENGLAL
jgi:NADH:ubiquinone oxidoreductase subunit 2 (subunit N)